MVTEIDGGPVIGIDSTDYCGKMDKLNYYLHAIHNKPENQMDRLQSMEVFVKVVECGSFTRAAAAMSMSTPMVSTHISQLENRLGVRLLNRTTRQMELTQDGEAYYGHCKSILGEIAHTEASLSRTRSDPQGRLRIDVPMSICEPLLVPVLPEFHRRFPDINLEIVMSNHAVDVGDAPSDIVIRHTAGEGATLIARQLGDARRIIVASPDYLARNGEPQTPDDLQHHQCIPSLDVSTGRIMNWVFTDDGVSSRRHFPCSIAFSQGGPRKQLAVLGFGVAQVLRFQVIKELQSGQLKRILIPWEATCVPISILYQKHLHLSAKQRAFIDFVLEIYPPGKELEPAFFQETVAAKIRSRPTLLRG